MTLGYFLHRLLNQLKSLIDLNLVILVRDERVVVLDFHNYNSEVSKQINRRVITAHIGVLSDTFRNKSLNQ